jgi:NADH:ubiquinone oxidoreductase subunit F (NADH-binding)/Pyruvate/2-oxoacid:ferredoxin oxidoreductase delta subunit
VGGESTALMHAVEGKASEPRPKHIHTTEKGVWGRPSCLNNVKTLSIVPEIINRGADWYASIGTETSKGTQVFSLAGKINNVGLAEVPMGITIRELVFEVGGGIPKGREFKAIQIGGPSGGFLPADLLDMPMDYETLAEAGSMMGTGGVIIADDRTCVIDTALYFLDFLQDESCGKCAPCREGVKRMYEILTRITEGQGEMEDLETLETLANAVKATSLCGLGKSAPNPVLSTLRYFHDEYVAHIEDKKCPAGVCKELIEYYVIEDLCNGCGVCRRKCPQEAISGKKKEVHVIDQTLCIKCGICRDVCKFDAVAVR